MIKGTVRIPKAIVWAAIISFLTLIVVSVAITVIVYLTPTSSFALVHRFLEINRDSPAVYVSKYYQELAGPNGLLDAFVATPLAMAVSGIVFGLVSGGKVRGFRATAPWAIAFSLIVSVFIQLICVEAYSVQHQQDMQVASYSANGVPFNTDYYLSVLLQIVAWVLSFTMFAVLGALLRRPYQSPSTVRGAA